MAFLCLRRGVSSLARDGFLKQMLFSAYAEVFPKIGQMPGMPTAFLCLRRGVSVLPSDRVEIIDFSLPTQRCFRKARSGLRPEDLFSAYAEVFLIDPTSPCAAWAFLCLRRGVSKTG